MWFYFLGSLTTKFHKRYVNRLVLTPSLGKKYKITRKSNRSVFIGKNVIFCVGGVSLILVSDWSLSPHVPFKTKLVNEKKTIDGFFLMAINQIASNSS